MLCLLATALASLPELRRVAMMRVHSDVMTVLETPECRDVSMPSRLEMMRESFAPTMTRLWDRSIWRAHRSDRRWRHFMLDWPNSAILASIRGPLLSLIVMTVVLAVFNRSSRLPRLTLPLAPLSLQATSIGLMLVFRHNQAHERYKEAQQAVGGLQSIVRELVELMLLHSGQGAPMPALPKLPPLPPAGTAEAQAAAEEDARIEQRISNDLSVAARLLAMFGWALKARLHSDGDMRQLQAIAAGLLPPQEVRLLALEPTPLRLLLLRLRAIAGDLRNRGEMGMDAFRFVEERISKLSILCATCDRLAQYPIPPSYHRHGSRALMLWLGSLPFALESLPGMRVAQLLVATAFTAFVTLGIDQIAIEIEQPFDVLPLHILAAQTSRQVADGVAACAALPCALPVGFAPKERGVEPAAAGTSTAA